MKPRLLQSGDIAPLSATELNARYDVHPLWKEADPAAFMAQHGAGFVGYVTSARFGITDSVVAALPNLKVISSFGVGTETLALQAAAARGIAVGYTPDVLNDCVADTAFGLLIDVARRIGSADRFLRKGEWLKGQYPLSTKVSGKRLGILGLGRIGQAIARRASGFDMEVRYHTANPIPRRHTPTRPRCKPWPSGPIFWWSPARAVRTPKTWCQPRCCGHWDRRVFSSTSRVARWSMKTP